MKHQITARDSRSGFSLTELLIAVAVSGILMAIAVPSYRDYVMRANRADATTALLRLASNQERFYLANNTYAGPDDLADAPPAGLGMPGTERGFYELTIVSDDLRSGYTATATAAGGGQENDDACVSFAVNERGQRSAENAEADENMDECWR